MSKQAVSSVLSDQRVTGREKAAIAIRKVGSQGVTTFMGSYGTVFLTEAYFAEYVYDNVAGTIGLISGISVIVGCIMNMIAGSLIYKLNLKGGKYRPWILFSSVPIFLYGFSYFLAPTNMGLGSLIGLRWVVMLLGSAINSFVSQTDNLLQVISGEDSEKKRVVNLNSIMNYVGYGAVYVFYAVFGSLKNAAVKFLLVVIIFAVIRLVGDILCFLWCKERISFSNKPIKLTSAGIKPLKYRPFLSYNVACWVRALMGVTGIVMASFCQCTVGSKNMLLVTIPSAVGTVIGLLIFMGLTKKFQAVRVVQCAGVYVLVMAITLSVVGFSVNWHDKTIKGNEEYIATYGEALSFAREYEGLPATPAKDEKNVVLKANITVEREYPEGETSGDNYTAHFKVSAPDESGKTVVLKEFEPVTHVKTATLLPILFYIFYFLFGFYFGFETIGYEHLKMECYDYLEWKMNERVEAVAGVVPSWIQSGLSAIKSSLIPVILLVLGFQNAVVDREKNTILTVAENIARAGADSYNKTCRLVLVIATVVTATAAVIASFVLTFYGLDKSKKETMYKELKLMREERKSREA